MRRAGCRSDDEAERVAVGDDPAGCRRGELRTEYTAALEHTVPALFVEAADLAAGADLDGR